MMIFNRAIDKRKPGARYRTGSWKAIPREKCRYKRRLGADRPPVRMK